MQTCRSSRPTGRHRSATAYRKVLANANPFEVDAARRNLLLFRELGLLSANVEAALKEMNQAAPEKPAALPARVVLFTGHMLDAPGRAKEQGSFSRTPEAEAAARKMIEKAVKEEMNEEGGVSFGIAGGACGSDILFHEVCNVARHPDTAFAGVAGGSVPGRVGQSRRGRLGDAIPASFANA